ncbi:MAG: hypothetical protein WAN34_12825 [Acidimicrobiia bacterium]
MSSSNPLRQLPANPNITQLKKQAKDLKDAVAALDAAAFERVLASHPSHSSGAAFDPAAFTLRDAQATLAREYGFDGWNQLNTHVGEQMIDARDLHSWFGVHLNNQMWTEIEDDRIGPNTPVMEKEKLLYSAYASAYHWRQVGNEANFARGEHLISRMAARLGEAERALHHGRRCLELVESNPEVMEDWDLAFAHEAMARGLAASGDMVEARSHREIAFELMGEIADDEDRVIVAAQLGRGPWFGLD